MSAARRTSRTVISAIALAALDVRANGRFPSAQWLAFDPSGEVVALQTTFGLLLSRDAARTFHWTCEEAMFAPQPPPSRSDTPVAVMRDGRVLFGISEGLRVLREGCMVASVLPLAGPVDDLAWTPDGNELFAIETPAAGPHRVLRASAPDFGVRVGAATDVRLNAVDVAPSRSRTLYLSGVAATGGAPMILRSDDGGESLRVLPASLPPTATPFVSGVDPRDPETIWVRTVEGLGSALYLSRNGGESFTPVARAADRMLGFAISDDGTSVWYGTAAAGLFRSEDGGRSFVRVSRIPVLCLRARAGELWMCTDWVQQPWALGRSRDGGRSFEGVLRWAALQGPEVCASGTTVATMCTPLWEAQRRTLVGIDVLPDAGNRTDASRDGALPEPDASLPDAALTPTDRPSEVAPVPGATGCGCHVGAVSADRAGLGCLVLGLFRRRRRATG